MLFSLLALAADFSPVAALAQASGIRDIEFNELSYRVGPPYCEYFGPIVKVHQGKFSNKQASFEVSHVLYGKLTDAGHEEAVVVASCIPQATAHPGFENNFVYVYGFKNGAAALLATFAWGQLWNFTERAIEPKRGDGLMLFDITGVSTSAGAISFEHMAGEARCCPKFYVTQTFRWTNGQFVLTSEQRRPWKENVSPQNGPLSEPQAVLNSHVFVEPWQTLVRDTIAVSAGRAVQYNFTFESGTRLSAQFQVEGGLNDKLQVYLMDLANYQEYSVGHPFRSYPGASGLVSKIANYEFNIPKDGVYYVVLDNGKAWLTHRSVTLHLDAVLPKSTPASEQLRTFLETLYSQLKQVFIFSDFRTTVRHCGVVNAFSNPNITLCVELLEELHAKGMDSATAFVYAHELGHTLMKESGLPLWDNEDAADEFATAFLLMAKQQQIALQAAQWWVSQGATSQDAVAKIWMDDRHSLSPQRARNIIRWVNNTNDLVPRWQHVFIPNMQTAALESMLSEPGVPEKDFIKSELSRRGASPGK